jgi:hypothetical protein
LSHADACAKSDLTTPATDQQTAAPHQTAAPPIFTHPRFHYLISFTVLLQPLVSVLIPKKVSIMPKQNEKKTMVKSTKLTAGEKKKVKNENKSKANPEKAAAKKDKNDAKRERRAESGSVKKLG